MKIIPAINNENKQKIGRIIIKYILSYLIVFLSGILLFFIISGDLTLFIKKMRGTDYELMYSFESRNFIAKESKTSILSETLLIGNTGKKSQENIVVTINNTIKPAFWKHVERDIFPVSEKRAKPLVTISHHGGTSTFKIISLPGNMLTEISWSLMNHPVKSQPEIQAKGRILKGSPSASLLAEIIHKLIGVFF